jgi:hypothetical protein
MKQRFVEHELFHFVVVELRTKHDEFSSRKTEKLLFVSSQDRFVVRFRTTHLILNE